MRLFAAVDLSPEARDAMAVEQKRIAARLEPRGASLKWVRPDRAHLTLVFLGNVDTGRVAPLVEVAGQPIDRVPFDITFSGSGVFPARGAPRVLWIGIGAGVDELTALQREVSARIVALGFPIEARDFHPHLTLGRWTSSRPSDRARALAAAGAGALARQQVAQVTLYESRLSAAGPAYVALARATLTRR